MKSIARITLSLVLLFSAPAVGDELMEMLDKDPAPSVEQLWDAYGMEEPIEAVYVLDRAEPEPSYENKQESAQVLIVRNDHIE